MRILMTMPGHTSATLFDNGPDNMREPFVALRTAFAAEGHALFCADESLEADALLAWDLPEPDIYARFVDKRAVLVMGEPETVIPRNWSKAVHARFDALLTWHDEWADGKRYHKMHFPMARTFAPAVNVPFEARKLLVNISSNKRASHPGELYSARYEVIRYGTQHLRGQFDFYGHGWQGLPGWGGIVGSKTQVLPGYKFAVAYENTQGLPGYITEKVFDAMRCGSVPAYWGASNVEDYIPAACYVDRRHFKYTGELVRYLQSMSAKNWEAMQQAGAAYLRSEAFKAWLPDAFVETVKRAVL